ncbi:hypothetical protein [Ferrovum myxofaciens]
MDQNGKMICISALFGIDAPEGAAVFVGNESLGDQSGVCFS